MFGLTSLGLLHTAISLLALAAGAVALLRDREISPATQIGRIYLWTTALTCLTGFGIFQHGGFGKPHVLGIVTLLVLAAATLAARGAAFGRAAPYVATIGMSATFLFHLIPGVTETFTRLPAGAPLFANAEDPRLALVTGLMLALFLVAALLQALRLRARLPSTGIGGAIRS
jgi:uncharacterized membrane protein